MDHANLSPLVFDLLLILAAGLLSGVICKRLGVSMLVGYLVVGVVIGGGGLGLVAGEKADLRNLAEIGALLLLFAIGIEFSLGDLARLGRFFFIGGSVQMVLVAVPVAVVGYLADMPAGAAVLVGAAAAFSSTVLVFRALEEWGQTASPHGRRAVGVLLFQDVALVPLMLVVPMLTGEGSGPRLGTLLVLGAKATAFAVLVLAARAVIRRWIVPSLSGLRSIALVVLFALTVLVGAGLGAHAAGLPPALGAFAAGLALSGNRLTAQIDALILPYRETFAVVFFVGLGTLMRFDVFSQWGTALVALAVLAGVFVLKTGAATLALRLVRLRWAAAFGMGLGLSQMGEFAFVLLSEARRAEVVDPQTYNLMLFVALVTMVLTPQLLKLGLRCCGGLPGEEAGAEPRGAGPREPIRSAVVVGLGPIGRQAASGLETRGVDVCLVDLNPVNLHPYTQQGFHTVTGDAADPVVLRRAGAQQCRLAVVTVPDDRTAGQTVRAIRTLNRACKILVRCRYQSNAARIRRAGADAVISEEAEAAGALLRLLDRMV